MCADINNVIASSLAHCCPYTVSILHSLYGTYYWKVNRHKSLSVSRKSPANVLECHLAGVEGRILGEGQQNCLKSEKLYRK